MASVDFEGVTKQYDSGLAALAELDLHVADGEFLVLVGPSGCGKTTTLRLLAGLEEATEGSMWIGDRCIDDVEPRDRDIAMVFQSYALYPHMTVGENIAYPLRLSHVSKHERAERVASVARLLHLDALLDRKPRQLSGGQRQRVAMGRAMVRRPKVFLMDEPLSNLDAKLRVQMRADVAELQRSLGTTTLYVTHDQTEAMTMGDRVAILDRGRLLQVDAPQELYRSPCNLFVATFIGSPAMNVFLGRLRADGDGFTLVIGDQTVTVPGSVLDRQPGLRAYGDRPIIVGIRPEQLHDPAQRSDSALLARLSASVGLVEPLGPEQLVHVSFPGIEPYEFDAGPGALHGDTEIADEIEPSVRRFVARLTAESRVRAGEVIGLGVAVDALHWFDSETGEAIPTAVAAGAHAG
jgi:multiple sugar transport system ATP-binding protein